MWINVRCEAMNEQDQSIWDHYRRGWSASRIGRELEVSHRLVQRRLNKHGGMRPAERRRGAGRLSFDDREEISRGIAAGLSANSIAERMERPASTISREIARNGGRGAYRAVHAEQAAWDRALRPKPTKLAGDAVLRCDVVEGLANKWSPEQIAGRLDEHSCDLSPRWGHSCGGRRLRGRRPGEDVGRSRRGSRNERWPSLAR